MDNGNDLEEEGGDDFVEIDDMLLDELDLEELDLEEMDLSGLLRRLNLLRQLLQQPLQRPGRLLRWLLRLQSATTQPRKRGHLKGSRDKELRKRGQKVTGGGDTTATGN
ncbi:hypothetical protein V8E54_008496 [Elaphomyces granulatus]